MTLSVIFEWSTVYAAGFLSVRDTSSRGRIGYLPARRRSARYSRRDRGQSDKGSSDRAPASCRGDFVEAVGIARLNLLAECCFLGAGSRERASLRARARGGSGQGAPAGEAASMARDGCEFPGGASAGLPARKDDLRRTRLTMC